MSQIPADEPYVLRSDAGGVATLAMNRGSRFNPLSAAMIAALDGHLRDIADDAGVRAVVLTGSGRGFSAGHDLGEMRAHTGDDAWQQGLFDACTAMMLRLTQLPPTADLAGLASRELLHTGGRRRDEQGSRFLRRHEAS